MQFDPPNMNPYEGLSDSRVRIERVVIQTPYGPLIVEQQNITGMSQLGDLVTIETKTGHIIDGEHIIDPNQLLAQCQEPNCGQFLTSRTVGACSFCKMLVCPAHLIVDGELGMSLCKRCYDELNRQRFWAKVRAILWPFGKRV